MKLGNYRLLLLLVCCLLLACKSQQHITKDLNVSSQSYPGTWHYQNEDRLFIVKIWQDGEEFLGHYKMVEVNNGVLGNTIYNSRRNYGNGAVLPFTISANQSAQYGLAGFIYDNTIINNPNDFKKADFQMKVTQQGLPGCATCTTTAFWKVDEITRGLNMERNHL
jgi:hypothetical protein